MGEARSEAATSAHNPTSGPCLTLIVVRMMAMIPSAKPIPTIHGNVATLPWMVGIGFALGIIAIILTTMRVRHGPEVGLWALVAASLLASPIAWHNYLVLLGPGILLLLARGRAAPAFLLLALQAIPAQWPLLWNQRGTVVASLALTLYLYILNAHWLALLAATKKPADTFGPAAEKPG